VYLCVCGVWEHMCVWCVRWEWSERKERDVWVAECLRWLEW